MTDKIQKLVKSQNNPVAVIQSDECPEKVLQFKPGSWGCAIAMLAAASKGNCRTSLSKKFPGEKNFCNLKTWRRKVF